MRLLVCAVLVLPLIGPVPARAEESTVTVDVKMVADEALAVLAILEKRRSGATVTDVDWARLFATEGYRRLKRRELAMQREFDDAAFREFVLSDALASRYEALAATLAAWAKVDPTAAARRALAYLPEKARIRATIYPVVKPRDNSFVFDIATDPAIFLYLEPAMSPERFENTLAHELHHIGFGTACGGRTAEGGHSGDGARIDEAVAWMGAFGEGLAMLAAAGGPDVHPHATSPSTERERWDADVARFDDDRARLERFFLDVAAGRLDAEKQRATAMEFYGVQGPWYTVGWRMAAVVEKAYGRERLIALSCDSLAFLRAYNEAAARHNRTSRDRLSLWSAELFETLERRGAR